MTSDQFLAQFETGVLAPGTFHHRQHVQLAWLYLVRYGRTVAEARLLDGLRAFAIRAGQPGKFDEALTRAWIDAVERARHASPDIDTFEEFLGDAWPAAIHPVEGAMQVVDAPELAF